MSLVKGKNFWKITNAISEENIFYDLKNEPEKLELCARVFSLLKKLVAGEEKNEKLFLIIESGAEFLKKIPPQNLRDFEFIWVLRILQNLGYVKADKKLDCFSGTCEWSEELLSEMKNLKTEALYEINRALSESHLIK